MGIVIHQPENRGQIRENARPTHAPAMFDRMGIGVPWGVLYTVID